MTESLTAPPSLARILARPGPHSSPNQRVGLIFITRGIKVYISCTKTMLFGIASRLNSNINEMRRALSGGHTTCVHREASEDSPLSKVTWEHFTVVDEEYF